MSTATTTEPGGFSDPAEETGPIGPVALYAFVVLLVVAPLMRGGNRNVALIALEGLALAFLAALAARAATRPWRAALPDVPVAVLVLSPLWLALAYLLPLPASLWGAAEGRSLYAELLAGAGIPLESWLPLSLVPDATRVSLFAGLPLVAAFLAGYASTNDQVKLLLRVFVLVAFAEIGMGLLQAAGGGRSALNFGAIGGRPFGTFANPNHFANYVGMALAVYIWLGWVRFTRTRESHVAHHRHARGRAMALWSAGAMLMVVGVLASRSRGAALSGIPAAALAGLLVVWLGTRFRSWRTLAVAVGAAAVLGISLVGFDMLAARFDIDQLALAAPKRAIQAATTLEGAWSFWPWGAGWGTYYEVYPRFQPPSLVGTADYAHHDYAQMLFEGGIFAALLMLCFAGLAVRRAAVLTRLALLHRRLRHQEMASAVCGVGLAGFLLHSLVEFNMHIPANAIVACLLAGIYLRPLPPRKAGDSADI